MRIINNKYLLIILLVGIIITSVIVGKSNKLEKVNNKISSQKISNKTFAMYTETDNGYEEYKDNKFPKEYILNLNKSKCIDNNGKEVDNILSYNNGEVTVTSGKTTYCYLYFDKSLGLEIKEENPNGLKIDKVRGEMYRFQGQATEEINNYICFGTSDKDTCTGDTNHYMYRIIGIEAYTGRVKVIKKEALEQKYQWYTDYDTDIDFPNSKIYEAISGSAFLENDNYVPKGWEEKISDNIWTYGDILSDSTTLGARQTGEGLYLTETGQKETQWRNWADKDTEGAIETTVEGKTANTPYKGNIIYYTNESGYWTKSFPGKVSLMYLHDYSYSVSDEARCTGKGNYEICLTGWIHLSHNDEVDTASEWTMTRYGWYLDAGWFCGFNANYAGNTNIPGLSVSYYVRPVFYINAFEKLLSGTGTLEDPFIIK